MATEAHTSRELVPVIGLQTVTETMPSLDDKLAKRLSCLNRKDLRLVTGPTRAGHYWLNKYLIIHIIGIMVSPLCRAPRSGTDVLKQARRLNKLLEKSGLV